MIYKVESKEHKCITERDHRLVYPAQKDFGDGSAEILSILQKDYFVS